ncbi:hypothetical protein [Acidovorax sp. Leaf78]|uniref:hypothetical protein n=1 Tax=Acidovorax sp. Leaf78 TaxID=1736237 RepID=UPI0012E0EC60|nr:hypothetical protein [Acidovorax sp. Leaf78]
MRTGLAEQWTRFYFKTAEAELEQTAFLCDAEVLPARYEDLQHLLKRLARRTRLARRIVKDTNFSLEKLGSKRRNRSSQWTGFLEPSVLKHKAFEYEAEVRVALRFGWEPSLLSGLDEERNRVREAAKGSLEILSGLKQINSAALPRVDETNLKHYLAPTPNGFISAAFIDPRAPAHKRDFIASFLRERGVEVKNSEAFGLSYTGLAAYPDLPSLFI